jgi:hypothetical protein
LHLLVVLVALLLASSGGCIGLSAQIGNMLGMNMVPADYDGLKGRRVAVVCVVPDSADGPETAGESLAHEVERYLAANVRNIEFVPRSEVASWLDVRSGGLIDYARMGESLQADRVLVIEFASFSYRGNATLHQGRADFKVSVVDTATGEQVHEDENPDLLFPSTQAVHRTDMTEDKFKRAYIRHLAMDIGRRFHPTELPMRFANKENLIE